MDDKKKDSELPEGLPEGFDPDKLGDDSEPIQ